MKKSVLLFFYFFAIIILQSCHSKEFTEVEVPLPEDLETEIPVGKVEEIKAEKGTFELKKLQFPYNAFAPEIDSKTMKNHYEEIYLDYVNDLNKMVKGTNLEGKTIEEILKNLDPNNEKLRHVAGGYYNHNLFFESMIASKKRNGPEGAMLEAINREFETFGLFKEEFKKAATTTYGSGFVWLIVDQNKKMQIICTDNDDNPLMPNAKVKGTPLLSLDLWEHSYMSQNQIRRTRYIEKFYGNINWERVYEKYEAVINE